MQSLVETIRCEQLATASLLDNLTIIHDDDLVGAVDCRETVSNDNLCLVERQTLKRVSDKRFGFRIERACCFVED